MLWMCYACKFVLRHITSIGHQESHRQEHPGDLLTTRALVMGGVTPPGKSHDPWVSHFPQGLSPHSLVSESGFPEVISKRGQCGVQHGCC